jgi:hypothetical protein
MKAIHHERKLTHKILIRDNIVDIRIYTLFHTYLHLSLHEAIAKSLLLYIAEHTGTDKALAKRVN